MCIFLGIAELKRELFRACAAGDLDRVRRVIAAGVDPKKAIDKDWFEETPLHIACRYTDTPVHCFFQIRECQRWLGLSKSTLWMALTLY